MRLYNKTGSFLFDVQMNKEIDRGGEGTILPHPTNPNTEVLKIYHDNITPTLTENSWNYLRNLDDNFIKPKELFYDAYGKLKGFSMRYVNKNYFRISTIFTKNQAVQFGIDDKIKNIIINNLIKLLKNAHDNSVIIGDLNPYNIFINKKGDVIILDCDSFQTPVSPHSGRLLDEIRDYTYGGKVCIESDYYALAINIFRTLTYVHPYKGIHKKVKSFEERVIKKLSILNNDPDIVIPNFYSPISKPDIVNQFKKIFNNGERFMFSPTGYISTTAAVARAIETIKSNNVTIKSIAQNIIDAYFTTNMGYIIFNDGTSKIYDVSNLGMVNVIHTLNNKDYKHIWVGNKNYIVVDNKGKMLCNNNTLITNFSLPFNFRFKQFDNFIFGVDEDNMYQINIDDILGNNINWGSKATYGPGFKFEQSPIQITGGANHIHFNQGNNMNISLCEHNIKNVCMKENIGIVEYIENNNSLKRKWFQVKNLKMVYGPEVDELYNFTIKKDLIFVPKDNEIKILRVSDFMEIANFDVKIASDQSTLFNTNAGIVILDDENLYLVNKK